MAGSLKVAEVSWLEKDFPHIIYNIPTVPTYLYEHYSFVISPSKSTEGQNKNNFEEIKKNYSKMPLACGNDDSNVSTFFTYLGFYMTFFKSVPLVSIIY